MSYRYQVNAYAKKVIDADKEIVRQIFPESETDNIIKYWKSTGEYGYVSLDIDGDIICFKESDPYAENDF